jgi:hypothetical protein
MKYKSNHNFLFKWIRRKWWWFPIFWHEFPFQIESFGQVIHWLFIVSLPSLHWALVTKGLDTVDYETVDDIFVFKILLGTKFVFTF